MLLTAALCWNVVPATHAAAAAAAAAAACRRRGCVQLNFRLQSICAKLLSLLLLLLLLLLLFLLILQKLWLCQPQLRPVQA
jgi:hypothetical protein